MKVLLLKMGIFTKGITYKIKFEITINLRCRVWCPVLGDLRVHTFIYCPHIF